MTEPGFADVLAAAAHFQELFAGAVLVGGTAAAAHAGHVSFDADHVLIDLRERFDLLLDALEATDEWATARVRRPVMILGRLDGIETGIRQLIRRRPLEVADIEIEGRSIRIPTLEEMARIKAWMVLRRNATRDYLDLVALADRLGERAGAVLLALDEFYADQQGAGGRRIATQLAKQLAQPAPYDLDDVDLSRYRDLVPKWRSWEAVDAACRDLAVAVLDHVAGGHVTLTHRHLKIATGTPVDQLPLDALDDLLERGDLDDWRALAVHIRRTPDGPLAQRLLKLCSAHAMYGTSRLWPSFIASLRSDGEEDSPAFTLAELRQRAGRTQADVAEALGLSQSDVSKLELRRDWRVSTLQRYVSALGGELQVAGRFGDEVLMVDRIP